ncbi:pneumococcal-type histidine triad protein [Gemella haemolysans]|uniref:pneumococcal-type histidine triad protein n=1 Tax=Gemella haemolysans TaxID=1379 RepID=UPI0023789A21|nr:pneumococcal-type histidine triad protein [Gemella haemolysans]
MKKLIKLEFDNTTRERKTEDSYSELYSYDKNNGSFEFEILNDTLTTEQVIALFKFTESNKIWKTTGTVEGNKVKVTFDTTLITQNETVICYLYFDEEQRTSDTFRFKFKVKVSEIDKMNRYEVKERFINNTVIVDRLDVVTKEELKEALKNVGGIATEGLLTEVKAEETYAKKSEAVDNTNFELVKNRVLALELKTDKDTVYDDSELKGRISVLEAREDNNTIYDDTNVRERLTALESKPNVDVNNFVTKDELASKNYLTEHQDTSNFALKSEIPQQYNDAEVKERLTTLENKPPLDLSNYATKEELHNISGSQPLADNLVTKEELENKHYISDVSNLATKEELQEVRNSQPTIDTSHLVTRDELESKGYLTTHQDLSEYAKKSELYNDSDLKARVEVLEQKTDKDTVYDDTPLKERVTALESKAIEGGAYDDSDLRNRVVALESKEDKDTKYDDAEVKRRLTELESKPVVDTSVFVTEEKLNSKGYLTQHQSLENLVTKNELEAKHYVTEEELNNKAYLTSHQDLSPYALKSELPTPYNDSLLNERVTALESKAIEGGAYNDTDLRNRVINLENKPPLDTSEFVTNQALESRGYIKDVSNFVTKEELTNKGYLTTHQSLDHVVTKDELAGKNYISDISNLVTKEELASKNYLTEHQPLTEVKNRLDVLEAKQDKDIVYNDTELRNRVTELESRPVVTPYNDTPLKERVEVLENKIDKDTVYNDEPIKERLTVLETKVDKDTVYNDSELRERVTNLENKPNVDLTNYVTSEQLENKHYLTQHQSLDNLVTKEELSTKGYVTEEVLNGKNYLTEHQNISHLVTKDELETKGYLTQHQSLEEYAKKSELYNDTDIKQRLTTLEKKPNIDTSNFVTNEQLEGKHYLTEHQPLTHLATTSDLEALRNIAVSKSELNNKVDTTEFNSFKDNVVTKTELAEKGYISDLSNYVTKEELHEATEIDYSNIVTTDELEPYAKKSELPTPYNDSALVSRVSALESKQDKDTVYNDMEIKQRLTALENRPSTGGNVQTQDTGWITISENDPLNGNVVKIRRINDVVHVSLSNPDNESTHLQLEVTDGHGAVLANKEIQKGFTPMRTIIVPVISNIETIMLSTDLSTTGQAVFEVENNRVTLKVYDKDITSGIPTNKYINDFSYFTEDPFPTNLH